MAERGAVMVRLRQASLCDSSCVRERSWGSWFPSASEVALSRD